MQTNGHADRDKQQLNKRHSDVHSNNTHVPHTTLRVFDKRDQRLQTQTKDDSALTSPPFSQYTRKKIKCYRKQNNTNKNITIQQPSIINTHLTARW